MQRLSLQPVTDFGQQALSAMRTVTPVEWGLLLGTTMTLVMVARGKSVFPFYAQQAMPTKKEFDYVKQVRIGAEEDLQSAMEEMKRGALENALTYVESALSEFDHAVKHNKMLDNMRINRSFRAKLLYLRAQIHYFQGAYIFAERDLILALDLYNTLIPAMNMLVHLYANHLGNPKKASAYLVKSHNRDPDQLFVKFYQHVFASDLESADKYAEQLMTLYRNHLENKGQRSEQWDRLHTTTPLLAIPDIMLKWIDYKLRTTTDPVLFFQIFKALEEILSEPELVNVKPLRNMLREAKICIFEAMVHLREADKHFTPQESELLHKHFLRLTDEQSTEYFVNYPVSQIDRTVISLFPLQLSTNFLTHDNMKDQVAYLIHQCAIQSWFVKETNPVFIELCQAVKSKSVSSRIAEICQDPNTIEYFAKHYLEKFGWNNWLRPIRCDNGACMSFIQLACKDQKINLCVHALADAKAKLLAPSLADVIDHEAPTLHLLYDGNNNKFELLHKVSTPSAFYEWSAFKLCWKLLEYDANNRHARQFLSERLCTLPPPVDHAKKEETSLVGRLFTPVKVGVVAAVGVAAAGYWYFGRE